MRRLTAITMIVIFAIATLAASASGDDNKRRQRRVTPITTGATTTQSLNETRGDTARINAARRASSSHYHRQDGAIVYIDTVTCEEWIDSAAIRRATRMKYPLLHAVNIGVDLWNPIMRAFGQKHGLVGFSADVSLHNRYYPTFEAGLSTAKNTPAGFSYTYRSPMSPYFKIGADYNFLYNSNPDYKFFAGLRYGFSPFKWAVDDVTLNSPYWQEDAKFNIPAQSATAGWLEFGLGLRIRLFGNIHAGWMIRYHSLIHESKSIYGKPWHIPGYGTRGQSISASFSISYTLPINKHVITDTKTIADDERPSAPTDTATIKEP